MKYLLLTYLDERAWLTLSEAQQQREMAKCAPHVERLISSGKLLAGAPLEPTSLATTVRKRAGRRLVTMARSLRRTNSSAGTPSSKRTISMTPSASPRGSWATTAPQASR